MIHFQLIKKGIKLLSNYYKNKWIAYLGKSKKLNKHNNLPIVLFLKIQNKKINKLTEIFKCFKKKLKSFRGLLLKNYSNQII